MVNKNIAKKNKRIKAERHIFLILLLGYIFGICIGCFFVLSDTRNADFSAHTIHYSSIKMLIYFMLAFALKYSGILNGFIVILPMIIGIQNSALYCYNIIYDNTVKYETASAMLRDTAISMLLILYIVSIVNRIINKKYNLKKDLKLFTVYFWGVAIVIILEYVFKCIF